MDEIDEQALDVRAIMILIRHDHDAPVSQLVGVFVRLSNVDSENFDQVLDLWVLPDLFAAGLPDVQELSSQRENTVLVSAKKLDTSECQALC